MRSMQNEEDIVEADITVRTESDCPSFIKLCILQKSKSIYIHFFMIWVESFLRACFLFFVVVEADVNHIIARGRVLTEDGLLANVSPRK